MIYFSSFFVAWLIEIMSFSFLKIAQLVSKQNKQKKIFWRECVLPKTHGTLKKESVKYLSSFEHESISKQ